MESTGNASPSEACIEFLGSIMDRVKVEKTSFNGRRVDHFNDVAAVSLVVWA